jgi:hypothetical protein
VTGIVDHISNKEISMSNDTLTLLRSEIADAAANMKNCQRAYKGIKAFTGSQQGLAFCAAQLRQAAGALRDAAEHLAALAENLHDTYSDVPEQLALDDISMDGRGNL